MRVLSAEDVRQAVPMTDAIDAVAHGFAQLAAGAAEVPLRTPIHVPEHKAVSLFMPARIGGEGGALGLKVVSVFPENSVRFGKPSIHALVVLIDPASGRPLATIDATYLTALRTGAASGLATRLLARENAKTLALFGVGGQALTQVLAVLAVRPIEDIWIVNRTRDHVAIFASKLRSAGVTINIRLAADAQHALAQADVVCTATSSTEPLFHADDVRPGTHINAIGTYTPAMAELPPDLLPRTRLFVDQRAAAWAEAGELVQARARNLIDESSIAGEIGELVLGTVTGRSSDGQISVFKSVGNAVQDLAVGTVALARAQTMNLGVEIDMGE
ncbi:ornithine cyclodeaminase [Candidatus Gracilibacteria bacterium]|nr:ornithine cyclodeaminase [Candidatus Gracilibacteria bacterium]